MRADSEIKLKDNAAKPNKLKIDIRMYVISVMIAMLFSLLSGFMLGPRLLPGLLDESSYRRIMESISVQDKIMMIEIPEPEDLTGNTSTTTCYAEKTVVLQENAAPSGQHLLMDINGVDFDFLDSEERLVMALLNIVEDAGLTIISHHCHKLDASTSAGVSCVGICVGSRISFHTFPEEGVISLDLFASSSDVDSDSLISTVPAMEKVFGIGEDTFSKWSHELRGFRQKKVVGTNTNSINEYSELSAFVLSPLDVYMKRELYSNHTGFTRVDIWEALDYSDGPSHEDGMRLGLQAGDPRWETPELCPPSRMAFHDGNFYLDATLTINIHEALVHPAMFAHANPKHVAIIGGADGGALREVLKHNTIQSATVVEQDVTLLDIYKQYFPEVPDCSPLIGRASNCFEDDLATTVHENYVTWLRKRRNQETADPLDVVIVNLWSYNKAPKDFFKFDHCQSFISALMDNLSEEGVAVFMMGAAPDINQPKADIGIHKDRELFFSMLETDPRVAAMIVYEEFNNLDDPNSYLIVCKNANCRSRFYARTDVIEYEMYERLVRTTKSEEPVLVLYDGMTQFSYQTTPKAWETIYCRREPTPFECEYRSLDAKRELHELYLDGDNKSHESSFELKMVKNDKGEEEGPYVFAKVDIPKGSFIMPEHLSTSLALTSKNLDGLHANVVGEGEDEALMREEFLEFIDQNSHSSETEGLSVHFVEIGGSILMQTVETEEEANVARWVPKHPSGHRPVFSPVYDRHQVSFNVFIVATKDIPAGGKVLKYKGMWN